MFPLQNALLPGELLPLRIFEPRYGCLFRDCVAAQDPVFGVVLISRGSEVGGGDVRHDVGTLARVTDHVDLGPGRYHVSARIGDRIRVTRWLPDDPYPRALIEPWPDEPGPPVPAERIGDVVDRILALYRRVASARGLTLPPDLLAVDADDADDPARHLWALAARVPMGAADRYAVLAAPSLTERVDVLIDAVETVTATVDFQLGG